MLLVLPASSFLASPAMHGLRRGPDASLGSLPSVRRSLLLLLFLNFRLCPQIDLSLLNQ